MTGERSTQRPSGRLVGVVLAGGRSRRMGRDKAALVVDGRSLVERAVESLRTVCAEVLLADAGRGRGGAGARSVADGPGRGPAAGILGAARTVPGRPLVVLACDVPAVPGALLARLGAPLTAPGPRPDAVVPRTGRGPEPLVAGYGPRALAALEEQVAGGEHAVHRLLDRPELVIEWIEEDELARYGDPAGMLVNVNTPEDLEKLARPGR